MLKKSFFFLFITFLFIASAFLASPFLAPQAQQCWALLSSSAWSKTSTPPDLPLLASSSPESFTMPEKFFPQARMAMSRLFNGMRLHTQITTNPGEIASRERQRDTSYLLEAHLQIQIPRPLTSFADFQQTNPALEEILPDLPSWLETARVSPFYHSLYQRKVTFTEQRVTRFNQLLSRHNFFDCETLLELTLPTTERKILLIQGNMDVVTDGTDPDRALVYDNSSSSFQPWTAYNWPRQSRLPENPFLASRKKEKAELKAKTKDPQTSALEKKKALYRLRRIEKEMEALRTRSSLVAELDPFIVLPAFMFNEPNRSHTPSLGDYALVIHQDQIYPAIVGDKGPNSKIGEASTLICTAIRPESNGKWRAASDLEITYLVFPGSADQKAGPPDLAHWEQRCRELLNEIGGSYTSLYSWMPAPPPPPEPPTPPAEVEVKTNPLPQES